MAIFNPEVPEGKDDMPSYIKGYSEPITQPLADKSTGLFLSTAGDALEGTAKLAATTATDIVNKDVRDTVEPIRSEFTQNLQAARDALVPAPVQTADGSVAGGPLNLQSAGDAAPPPAVKAGIDKIGDIQNAFVNGKINDTWYHSNLASAVTTLRARYPGFVDQIDSEVSKITGVNPANAVIGDLMADINRAVTTKKTEQDKVLDIARTEGIKFDKGNFMYERLKADPSFAPQFMEWYSLENSKSKDLEYENLRMGNLKGTKEWVAGQQKTVMQNFVSSSIDSDFHSTLKLSGMDKPMAIMDIIQDANANPGKYTGPQMQEFATKMQSHSAIIKQQLTSQVARQYPLVSPADRAAEVETQMGQYDIINKALSDEKAGLAYYAMQQARSRFDDRKNGVSQSDIGADVDNFKIVSDALGPAMSGILVPSLLKTNVPERLSGLFQRNVIAGRAQPDPNNPASVVDHMAADANNKAIDKKTELPYMYKGYVDTVNDLKNTQLPIEERENVVKYLFNPKNNSMMQNFNMDYKTYDANGRLQTIHPGKYDAWTTLTDNDVTKNMKQLSPQAQSMYKNWVDITGREVIGQDVKTLSRMTGHDNLFFDWDTKNKQLILRDNEGGLASPVGQDSRTYTARPPSKYSSYRQDIQDVVDRINRALPNLNNVYSTLGGGDTEVMLLQTLKQYGMDFEGKISGLPKAFGDAIAASRKPLKPEGK